MSSKAAQGIVVDSIDEAALAQYLAQSPDFFERHPQLLTRMRLQHPRNGGTISLIERQVEVLREKHAEQERMLGDFVQVARANDQLADKIHQFTRRLLRAGTREAVIAEIESSLRGDFDAPYAVLILPGLQTPSVAPQLLRSVADDDAELQSFSALFAAGKPRCGQVRDSQRAFLFGSEADGVGSVALVPLMSASPPGLLAMGSPERERVHPGMSTDFLARMGELIVAAVYARPVGLSPAP